MAGSTDLFLQMLHWQLPFNAIEKEHISVFQDIFSEKVFDSSGQHRRDPDHPILNGQMQDPGDIDGPAINRSGCRNTTKNQ